MWLSATSATGSLCTRNYEIKQQKPWFDEDYSKLSDKRMQVKLQWLQNPKQLSGGNQSNVQDRLIDISGNYIEHFWKTQSMSWKQTVRTKELFDCFELKKGEQKNLRAVHFYNIVNRWRNYFCR